MPFDPKVPATPQFWSALERRLRDAVRLRALRERRVQMLQSAAGAVATVASFGAAVMMVFGPTATLAPTTAPTVVTAPAAADAAVVTGTPQASAYYPSATNATLPDRLTNRGYEVTVLTRYVTDPRADGRVLDVRGPTQLDVASDPAAGPVVIVIGQAIGTGLSFAG